MNAANNATIAIETPAEHPARKDDPAIGANSAATGKENASAADDTRSGGNVEGLARLP